MQTFRDLSIKRKLTLSGVATSVVVLVLASIVFAVHEYMAFRDDTVAHRESTAFIVGSNCTVTLTFEDPEIAAELLSALEKQPYIAAAAVYDATGTLFARYLRADTSPALVPASPRADDYYIEDDGLMVFKPIIYEDERLGTIFLRSDTEALNAELRDIGLLILLVLAVSSLLAYLLSVRLQAFVSEPVAQLAQTARVITSQHDYTLRAKSGGRDEVGRLVEAFNQMLEELQREPAPGASNPDAAIGENGLDRPAGRRRRARTEQPDRLYLQQLLDTGGIRPGPVRAAGLLSHPRGAFQARRRCPNRRHPRSDRTATG